MNIKNDPIKICDAVIHPGEGVSLALPLPEIFSSTPIYMPIKVRHGKQPGPCILVMAAIHGDEFNGTEIINRLNNLTMLKRLHGTLITIPVFNVYGFITRSRYLIDGSELDRYFPGSEKGSHAARLAHLFTTEILTKANYCIDLRTGSINHSNLPHIYINKNDEEALKLAKTFAPPVISYADYDPGSLRKTATKHDIPYLLYEAGEAMRFNEGSIKVGVRGIVNVMRQLQMLPADSKVKTKKSRSCITEKTEWIRAATSGIAYSKIKLGQQISKGSLVATIKDPFGASPDDYVYAPCDGVIVGKNNLPMVHEGQELFQIAMFAELETAASHLEEWQTQSQENTKAQH